MNSRELLDELRNVVVAGDVRKARRIVEQLVNRGLSAKVVLEKLMEAMHVVDKKYERKEYFITDVAAAASAMREAFKILEPYLQVEPAKMEAKIVIGSLKGNIQSLGKDIVAATLQSAGFHVVNLGVDVAPETFVDAAAREGAKIVAVSVTMDETVSYLKDLVQLLEVKGLRDKVKVVVGGRAVSEKTCEEYGVDAYAKDAWDCVKKVQGLLASESR
ncbi:MAG: cobalamin-dependent protein [Candidatus Bathyarchaeia archaeon]